MGRALGTEVFVYGRKEAELSCINEICIWNKEEFRLSKTYGKIFIYELKRMTVSWLFPAMLVVNGVYAWFVLTTDILMGAAHTAPFSVWSYCVYIGKMMPTALTALLLLLAGYYGKKQKQAEVLLSAAPVTASCQLLIRSAVLGVCFLVICAVEVLIAVIFYSRFFHYYHYERYLIPSLFIILPCFLFVLGLGHLAGRMHEGVVFLTAGGIFLAGFGMAANVFDFFGAEYFAYIPLTLQTGQDGEPGFVLDAVWMIVRLLYGLLGMALVLINIYSMNRKPTKA